MPGGDGRRALRWGREPRYAGGYRLAAGAHMPPLLLDDEEAVAIAVGLRAAAGASVAGIEDTPFTATVVIEAPAAPVEGLLRWTHAEVAPVDEGSCRVVLASESEPRLDATVVRLAASFALAVEDTPEMAERLAALADRLRMASTSS